MTDDLSTATPAADDGEYISLEGNDLAFANEGTDEEFEPDQNDDEFVVPDDEDEDTSEPDDDEDGDEEEEQEEAKEFTLKTPKGGHTKHTRSEVVALAQKALASESMLEDSKKALKEAEQFKTKAQNSMKAFFELYKKGDFDAVAEIMEKKFGVEYTKGHMQWLMEKYKEFNMSPEQKEALANKRELDRMKRQNQRREEQEQTARKQYVQQQVDAHLKDVTPKAFDAAGLEHNQRNVVRFAQVWRYALKTGQNVTAEQVARYVKQELGQTNPTPKKPAPTKKKRVATPESVRRKPKANDDDDYYISMESFRR